LFLCGRRGLTEKAQAYELLEWAVKTQWNLEQLPPVERLPGGKPQFAGGKGPQFNLSHSGSYGLCAVDDLPVGVDIQIVRELRPRLPEKVCSPAELEWLDRQEDRWRGFARLWALKESFVKQRGGSIIAPGSVLRALDVPLPEAGLLQRGELWFRCFSGPDWEAAVCGLSAPPECIFWEK